MVNHLYMTRGITYFSTWSSSQWYSVYTNAEISLHSLLREEGKRLTGWQRKICQLLNIFPQIVHKVYTGLMAVQAFLQTFPVQTVLIFGSDFLTTWFIHLVNEVSVIYHLKTQVPFQIKIYILVLSLIKALNAVILSSQTFCMWRKNNLYNKLLSSLCQKEKCFGFLKSI